MTKLFGYLGAASALTLCGLAACTVSSTSDVSGTGSDGGKSDSSTASDSSSTSDGSSTTDGGGDGGSCKLAYSIGDAACDTCMTNKCCEKVNACEASAECKALNSCYEACAAVDSGTADAGGAQTACFSLCDTAHPTGLPAFDDIINCSQTNCSAQCPN